MSSVIESQDEADQEPKHLLGNKLPFREEKCIFFKQIILKPNISKWHYMGSLIHYLVMPFIFVSVEVLQPILFQNKFNVQPEDSGTANSNVLLADILTKIIFAPFFGILNDKIGRQLVLLYGICIITLALCLMPFAADIYPAYLCCRILYAHGAIAVATIPLLADYVIDSTKGKASAINVFGASIGAIMSSSLINQMLQKNFSTNALYWSVAGLYFALSMGYIFVIKRGVYNRLEENQNQKRTCSKVLKIGFKASFNPWILMGYITNFIGRGDSILLTLFLVLWSYNQGNQQNYHDSEIQAQTLSGVCYTVVMIFSVVYGLMFEKVSKFKVLGMMFAFTSLGCLMFTFADNPKGIFSYITMVVLGIGLSGQYTAALYLVNKYAYTNYRGYITGLANIFSVLGITVCVLGGYAVNKISFAFPFTLFGILSFIALIILIICYFQHQKKLKQYKENQTQQSAQSTLDQGMEDLYYEDIIYQDDYCLNQKEDQLIEQVQ